MTSNTTTGERRWTSARRGGMTVLGKVPVPKPINLPSQRSENHGLDPDVEIVPKGTHSWGSRSSSGDTNAWSTSGLLSPSTDGSGGTRPSTAGSEIARDSNVNNTWSSNSRPSSASGSSSSVKIPLVSLRPRSAETRPGSSQLSRFAESSLESGALGSGATSEQIGLGNPGKDGFSLNSGDFPTLGSEKDESRKNTEPRDDVPRDADSKYSSYRKDGPFYEDGLRPSTQTYNEEPYPYRNPNIAPYYESWLGAPSRNPTVPMWYRGPPPYGGFPMEPFPYNHPRVRAPSLANSHVVIPHGVGPHRHYASNGDMYRPHMPESYMRPGMPVGPGFFPGPVPYEGYYGPSMGLCNPSDRDLSFMGRPTGPPVYGKHINPNVADPKHSHFGRGEFGAPDEAGTCNAHDPHENFEVLRKESDNRSGNDGQRWGYKEVYGSNGEKGILSKAPTHDNAWEDDYKKDDDMRFEKIEKVNSRLIEHEVGSSEGCSLMQKIECLNAKDRSPCGAIQDGNDELDGTRFVDSKADRFANDASLNIVMERRYPYGVNVPFSHDINIALVDRNHEITVPFVNATSRELARGAQGVVSPAGSGSNVENQVVEHHAPLYPAKVSESNVQKGEKESQRAKMKEIAKQRALERQKEEEERIRDQKAKALAKLEELNWRSTNHDAPLKQDGPRNHFTNTNTASTTNFVPKNEIGAKQRQNIAREKNSTYESTPEVESPDILTDVAKDQRKSKSGMNENKLEELPTNVTCDPNITEAISVTEHNISNLNTNSSSIQSTTAKDVSHTSVNHSALSHEDVHTRQNNLWKPQYSRKPRSSQGNRSEKTHSNDTVVWAPVRPHNKVEIIDRIDQKSDDDVVDNGPRTKRAEMERYVPKPVDGKHKQRAQGSRSQLADVESGCVQVSNERATVVTVKDIGISNGSGKNVSSDETSGKRPPSRFDHELPIEGSKVIACDGWNDPNDSDLSLSAAFAGGKVNVHAGRGERPSFKGHKGTYSNVNLEGKGSKAGSTETSQKETTMPSKGSTAVANRVMSHWKPKTQVYVAHDQEGNGSRNHQSLVAEETSKDLRREVGHDGVSHKLSRHNQGGAQDPFARECRDVDGGISSSGRHKNMIDKSVGSVPGRNASSNRGFVGKIVSGPSDVVEGHRKNANRSGRFKKGPESRDWDTIGHENKQQYLYGNPERQRPNSHFEYQRIDSYNSQPNEHGSQTENRTGGMKFRGMGQSQVRRGQRNYFHETKSC